MATTANYVLLERIELNASAASVDFTNIPQSGYTDLKIVVSGRINAAAVDAHMYLTFNNNASNAYSFKFLRGNGAAASSYAETNETSLNLYATVDGNSATSNTFSNAEIYIPNYTSSNYKSLSVDAVQENNATTAYQHFYAGIWNNTAAITSVKLTGSASWLQYSTFSLYGLAAVGTTPVIAPKASGGNITTDGTYWYHTFLASGSFTPNQALTCDYLVVAGGAAGGGGNNAGGGGAGGLRCTVGATGGGGSLESPLGLTSGTSYTVTIGAGGASATGSPSAGSAGASGSNSVFSTITSLGGGGGFGGDLTNTSGVSGGSGGGNNYATTTSPASGTSGQGYAGGVGGSGTSYPAGNIYTAGGGGGAGQAGNTTNVGVGGNGVTTSISGSSVTYGGGGGGATNWTGTNVLAGGTGGGGSGANNVSTAATSGTVNTGGGGGGTTNANATSGAGGSGIVIVRYTVA